MKITKRQLRRIIKEELKATLKEGPGEDNPRDVALAKAKDLIRQRYGDAFIDPDKPKKPRKNSPKKATRNASANTVQIAGRTVRLANEEDIRDMVGKESERSRGARYSDTHSFMGTEEGESPEETVKRLARYSRGMPGSITIYQDPDTGKVFGYAKYNTF